MSITIDALWEYSDPALSEKKFLAALDHAHPDERLELRTQIARTYSLRKQFTDAHALLDEVKVDLADAGDKPKIRYQLERGRTYNSSGDNEKARAYFKKALNLAEHAGEKGLAVDAAHMIAISYAGSSEGIAWNQKALSLARESNDEKARALIPALLNNTAWDLHDMQRFEEALNFFKEAKREWQSRKKAKQIRIATWSVARCLRSLHKYDEALEMLYDLEKEYDTTAKVDGFVFEEIAENLLAQKQKERAKPYFAKAYGELKKNDWIVQNESKRLERLKVKSI